MGKAMVLPCNTLLLLCLSLFGMSYVRPGRHFLIETDSNEGNHHRAKTSPRLPKADNGDDFATMSNKGDNHARKDNKGDDYAGRKGKTRAKAKKNANAKAIAKAKLELLQALKANKGDDYASKPRELFVDAAAGKAISSKPKRGDDYVDYAAYMRNEECDEESEEWRENGMTCKCHGGKHVTCASDPSCTDHEDGTRTCVG